MCSNAKFSASVAGSTGGCSPAQHKTKGLTGRAKTMLKLMVNYSKYFQWLSRPELLSFLATHVRKHELSRFDEAARRLLGYKAIRLLGGQNKSGRKTCASNKADELKPACSSLLTATGCGGAKGFKFSGALRFAAPPGNFCAIGGSNLS